MLFIVYADYLKIMHEKIEMEPLHLAESLDNIKTVESHGNAWPWKWSYKRFRVCIFNINEVDSAD